MSQTDPTHLDKTGTPLAKGDRVELVYGGDAHTAIVTDLGRHLDVDYLTLDLETEAIVPSGSVTLLKKADKPKPAEEKKEPTTPTTHQPTHRSASTRRK
jgi:hypothetical protein